MRTWLSVMRAESNNVLKSGLTVITVGQTMDRFFVEGDVAQRSQ